MSKTKNFVDEFWVSTKSQAVRHAIKQSILFNTAFVIQCDKEYITRVSINGTLSLRDNEYLLHTFKDGTKVN